MSTLSPRSYAWFEIGMTAQGRVINEAQEEASRKLVADVVSSAAEQLGVPPERVVVGGFSQGGIMSLSLLLTQPALLKAAMVMHSRLLDKVVPLIVPAAQLQGKKLWLSHGTDDQMITLAHAHAVRDRVQALPIELRYEEFPGGHSISGPELDGAVDWLGTLAS